jgi:methionyl-tRNA synthetase
MIASVNRYIDSQAPWTLAKSSDPADKEKLKKVLFQCHEALRVASVFLLPIIPTSARKALKTLGASESHSGDAPLLQKSGWGQGPKEIKVEKPEPLFPRLENKS